MCVCGCVDVRAYVCAYVRAYVCVCVCVCVCVGRPQSKAGADNHMAEAHTSMNAEVRVVWGCAGLVHACGVGVEAWVWSMLALLHHHPPTPDSPNTPRILPVAATATGVHPYMTCVCTTQLLAEWGGMIGAAGGFGAGVPGPVTGTMDCCK